MRHFVLALAILHSASAGAQPIQAPPTKPSVAVPLVSEWSLDLARTHYGPGVDRRRSEMFSCAAQGDQIRCEVRSVRADGHEAVGRFTAPLDGTGALVTGISDVDEVRLRRPSDSLLDATFLLRGTPVFGYRALQSSDGRSLMFISVDPVSRVALTTVVVYDRR
jgi:hypothetical protein